MKVVKFAFLYLQKTFRPTLVVYCLLSLITGGMAVYSPIINEKFINILTGTIQGSYTFYIVQFCVISIINLCVMYFTKILGTRLHKESSYAIVSKTLLHLFLSLDLHAITPIFCAMHVF